MSKSSKTKTKQGTTSSPSKQQEENNQLKSVIEALKNKITKLENKVSTLEVENLESTLTVAINTSSRLCSKVARLEHVYMRPEVNSNRFEISLWGKTSLQYEVTSLSAFTWLRA